MTTLGKCSASVEGEFREVEIERQNDTPLVGRSSDDILVRQALQTFIAQMNDVVSLRAKMQDDGTADAHVGEKAHFRDSGGDDLFLREPCCVLNGLRNVLAFQIRRGGQCSPGAYDPTMPRTLGIVTIGQAPRNDIADLFAQHAPAGTRVVLCGALDGLSDAEVDAAKPENGADTLYTRLRGGRDVKISKKAVIARSPQALAKLRAGGCDAIVYACTGEFPPMDGDEGVLFPSRVLNGLATGLLPRGRLGLLIPLAEQSEKLAAKWARPGLEVFAEALAPSADTHEADAAARRLAARKPDLVAMDCMSYTPATKEQVKPALGVPALLAITATGRVLREMLE